MVVNIKNLKPCQSKEEARERGKKGGIKSGEIKRERKTLKDSLKILLEIVDPNGLSNQDKIIKAIYDKALLGDVKAFEVIRDTIGEKPVDKIENLNPTTIINNQFDIKKLKDLNEKLKS